MKSVGHGKLTNIAHWHELCTATIQLAIRTIPIHGFWKVAELVAHCIWGDIFTFAAVRSCISMLTSLTTRFIYKATIAKELELVLRFLPSFLLYIYFFIISTLHYLISLISGHESHYLWLAFLSLAHVPSLWLRQPIYRYDSIVALTHILGI
jgi:hypothetical protein